MFPPLADLITQNLPLLITFYWVCLVVGGGLVVLSILGGVGDGADADADLSAGAASDFSVDGAADLSHADLPHELHAVGDGHLTHADAVGLSQWFSLRFLVYFAAMFGAVGVILTYLTDLSPIWILSLALLAGAAVGQGFQQVMMYARRTAGDSTPRPQDYVQRLARVSIPIRPPDKGEVTLQVRGTERSIPALAQDGRSTFAGGAEVVVVAYRAGIAEVQSREKFIQAQDRR